MKVRLGRQSPCFWRAWIPSNRRLERESRDNIELKWLTRRLMPDYRAIANLQKDSKAILGSWRQFIVQYQQLGRFGESLVAVDGSKWIIVAPSRSKS